MTARYLFNASGQGMVSIKRPWSNLGDGFGPLFPAPRGYLFMRSVAAVVALVVCVHAGIWGLLQRQQAVPDFDGPLASISYSPYSRAQHPDLGDRPTAAQIRADLKLIAPYARAIRTYSSTGGVEQVPAIAAEFGLKVAVGIWIDKNEARNEREIQSAVDLARHHTNVTAIVVGNMVGSGFYLSPSAVAPYGLLAILAWIVMGVGAVCLGLTLSSCRRQRKPFRASLNSSRSAETDLVRVSSIRSRRALWASAMIDGSLARSVSSIACL